MKLKILLIGCYIVSSILFFPGRSFAEDLNKEILELKQRISILEQKLNKQEEKATEQQELDESLNEIKEIFKGISVAVSYTHLTLPTKA